MIGLRLVGKILLRAAAISGVLWLTGCERGAAPGVVLGDLVGRGAAAGYNVLLITLDTTRADHLGCYGYEGVDTPAIDSLGERGVRFDHAFTSMPMTLPAHTTILTGLEPYRHGVRNNGRYRLLPGQTTLAEILKEQGYATAAFVSSFVLDRRFGLDQGFDVYDFEVSTKGWQGPRSLSNEREANHVTAAAIEWLKSHRAESGSDPFFLWVHYFDPHAPYDSPLKNLPARPGVPPPIVSYDAEIAFVDSQLQRLLDVLDRQALRDRTLIVLVSDHGESLGDHGEDQHGVFLYDATMRVALILSCPTLFEGSYWVNDRVVGTVDIVPTVADLVDARLPGDVDGRSMLIKERDTDRGIYLESLYPKENLASAPLYGLRRLNDKFILAPRSEYYDLKRDAGELKNRYGKVEPALVLERRLTEIIGEWSEDGAAVRTMSKEEAERLAALGYVSLSGGMDADDLPDPKDRLPIMNRLREVDELKKQGRFAEALVIATEIADQVPGVDNPIMTIAELQVRLGRPKHAMGVLEEFAESYYSSEVMVALARLYYEQKRYEQMERALQAVEIKDPERGAVPLTRGDRYYDEERYEEAVREYEKAIRIDGERVGRAVGVKLRRARELAENRTP